VDGGRKPAHKGEPNVDNRRLAAVLRRIADLLDIEGDNPFRANAYRRAAQAIETCRQPVAELPDVTVLPGVGKGVAAVVEELVTTGRSALLEELEAKIPSGLLALLRIPGLGPKKVGVLYRELGVASLADLEKALDEQRVRSLPGFGAKTEQNLRRALRAAGQRPERLPLAYVLPVAAAIEQYLARQEAIVRFSRAGSLRRWKETVKDLDFVVATALPDEAADALAAMPGVARVIAKGPTKVSVELDLMWPVTVDFRLVPPESFASALHHFTGSAEHHVRLRQRAKARGLKLSEYGAEATESGRLTAFATEEALYAALDLPYIPPELREGEEEIEAAEAGWLPHLVEEADVRGDLHLHTTWSDGGNTLEEMAEAARRRGYAYIAVTDHSQSLKIAGGLSPKELAAQREAIADLNKRWDDFAVLTGVEMDILPDGRLDYPDDVLKELDVVIGSIHQRFRQDEDTLTKRIIGAIENNHVDIIAHPTGRLIARRDPYPLNLDAVFEAARETGTALELNSNPNRLDLKPEHLRRAKALGVPIAVNSDAHSVAELDNMRVGIGTARRGWLEKQDILNTRPLDALLAYLRRND